ncbi:glutathione S-transferase-like [Halyomorpha halys]|uniref:glutathione S-transferase-like n=1 Tax=Halyomorpha halys TaxID=286706 RepID=UPI0006D4F544
MAKVNCSEEQLPLKMPKYKLTYFNFKGYGEPIRLMLSYLGKDWEDHRVSWEEWAQLKEKTAFGKIPILEFDGKVLHQSLAILKYLAHDAGLAGKNAEENLQIDMVVGAFGDLASGYN